jgi:hypothetical protein
MPGFGRASSRAFSLFSGQTQLFGAQGGVVVLFRLHPNELMEEME